MDKSTRTEKILIIDDEEGIRISLRGILEDEGYTVLEAGSGEEGLKVLEQEEADLVFLDIWLPGIDGPHVLERIKISNPQLPVLMISGHATIEHAVSAIKNGAHDFIEKPLSLEKVLISVERALEFKELKRENQVLRAGLPQQGADNILGNSEPIQAVRSLIDKVAPLDTWVLITGENGTGKEVAARYIHARSSRKDKPLVAVNCAAIPEELIESELFGHEKGAFTGAESAKTGKFELAHQGTLFLDEIGDMSVKTQAKILRILQERKFERVGGNRTINVDVRVIAATNKDLEAAIAKGEFRQDLYYRLRVFPLYMPPLRERGNDVLLMLDYYNKYFQQKYKFDPISFDASAKSALLAYHWPGNVRELRNFLERIQIIHGGVNISAGMLPPEILHGVQLNAGHTQNASANPAEPSAAYSSAAGYAAPAGYTGAGGYDTPDKAALQMSYQNINFQNSGAASTQLGTTPATGTGNLGITGGNAGQQPAEQALQQEMSGNDFKKARNAFEATYLKDKLNECEGNISRLAEAIGMERSYLHRKLKSLGVIE